VLLSEGFFELLSEILDQFDDLLDFVLVGLWSGAELDEGFEDWSKARCNATYGLYVGCYLN